MALAAVASSLSCGRLEDPDASSATSAFGEATRAASIDCFSNFAFDLAPANDLPREAAEAERKLGFRIRIPSVRDLDAFTIEAGIIPASDGGGDAFAIELAPKAGPTEVSAIQVIYSQLAPCSFELRAPLRKLYVESNEIYVFDEGLPIDDRVFKGMRAVWRTAEGTYIDVMVVSPSESGASKQRLLSIMEGWIQDLLSSVNGDTVLGTHESIARPRRTRSTTAPSGG